jgi:hypothetical protein
MTIPVCSVGAGVGVGVEQPVTVMVAKSTANIAMIFLSILVPYFVLHSVEILLYYL